MTQRRKSGGCQDGFSLAEVLISVTVLGVLAGTVAVNTSDLTDLAQTSACQADAAVMRTAVAAFRAMHGRMPQEAADLVPGYVSKVSTNVTIDITGSYVTYAWTAVCADLSGIGAP